MGVQAEEDELISRLGVSGSSIPTFFNILIFVICVDYRSNKKSEKLLTAKNSTLFLHVIF